MRRSSTSWQCKSRRMRPLVFLFAVLVAVWYLLRYLPTGGSSELTAVVILGGGVTPDGGVPSHTQLRLDVALQLHKKLGSNALFFPLSAGTPHKPNPVDVRGFPILECTAAARKLISMGIPPSQIFEETTSLDTVGNVSQFKSVFVSGQYCDFYLQLTVCLGLFSPRRTSHSFGYQESGGDHE